MLYTTPLYPKTSFSYFVRAIKMFINVLFGMRLAVVWREGRKCVYIYIYIYTKNYINNNIRMCIVCIYIYIYTKYTTDVYTPPPTNAYSVYSK